MGKVLSVRTLIDIVEIIGRATQAAGFGCLVWGFRALGWMAGLAGLCCLDRTQKRNAWDWLALGLSGFGNYLLLSFDMRRSLVDGAWMRLGAFGGT